MKKTAVEYVPGDLENLANEIVADLDAITAKVARFEQATRESEENMRAFVNVPKDFMVSTVALVEQRNDLLALKKLDPVEARETLEYMYAFPMVYDRVNGLARQVKLDLKSRKARLASQCMQIYAIIKSLARDGHDPGLAAYVEILGRNLGPRGRPRKKRNEPQGTE